MDKQTGVGNLLTIVFRASAITTFDESVGLIIGIECMASVTLFKAQVGTIIAVALTRAVFAWGDDHIVGSVAAVSDIEGASACFIQTAWVLQTNPLAAILTAVRVVAEATPRIGATRCNVVAFQGISRNCNIGWHCIREVGRGGEKEGCREYQSIHYDLIE